MPSGDVQDRANTVLPCPRPMSTALAWLVLDVTHIPGVLRLVDGRLRFVSTRRVVFDATPADLDLAVVRSRRGTFRVTVDGERLSLSVVRPSGAVPVPTDVIEREGGVAPTRGGAEAAARWRALLTPAAASITPRSRGGRAGSLIATLGRAVPAYGRRRPFGEAAGSTPAPMV